MLILHLRISYVNVLYWVDNTNIKINLREIEMGGMDWTDRAQVMNQWRVLVDTVMTLRVP
jgi:hypothetical protein